MLNSTKIMRRQSEIRQSLAELVGKDNPTEDETRSMGELDTEFRSNETRYRAALIAEDDERREAGDELESRSETEWKELASQFEVRQVALALDTGEILAGATAEMVQELRAAHGFQGIPVPLEALETRAGETLAGGVPDPIRTMPTIDRIFANSSASQMGCRMINVGVGEIEYPVATAGAQPGWAGSETGEVPGPQAYTTVDKAMTPDNTLGVQMKITRKALKQAGAGLEMAVRRDMSAAIQQETDRAIFLGAGSSGEPLGVLTGASTYGITETAIDAAADFDMVVDALTRFMVASAARPGSINMMIRPEVWSVLMKAKDGDGNYMELVSRITRDAGRIVVSNNGVSPIFCGMWGAVDMIRDPYSDAKSGQLRLTALTTLDVTVARGVQLEILTGVR